MLKEIWNITFLWRSILWMTCLCSLSATAQHYSFNKVTQTADTEFPSRLSFLQQDSRGYLWIATRSGLGRYDGNQLKKYTLSETDSLSLPGNDVYYVAEDNDQDLWVFTIKGVARYDYHNDQFIRLYDSEGQPIKAYAGCAWQSGILLMEGNAIFYYDKPTGRHTRLASFPGNYWAEKMILLDDNRLLCQCRSNRAWCFTLNGTEEDSGTLDNDLFYTPGRTTDILLDTKQRVWLATRGNGLYCFTHEGKLIKRYTYAPSGLPSNLLMALTERSGLIVIGTNDKGVVILNPETDQFRNFQNSPGEDQFTLPGNMVNKLYTDRFDNVLMGVVDHGLVLFSTVYLRTYTSQSSGFGKGPTSSSIMSILPEEDHVWIGTATDGLNLFHPADNSFRQIPSTKGMSIFSMTDFAPGKLLLSIYDVGCRIMDTHTGQLTPFKVVNDSIDNMISHYGNGNYVARIDPETILILAHRLIIYHQRTHTFTIATEDNEENNIVGGTLRMVGTAGQVSYLTDRQHLFKFDHQTEKLWVIYTHDDPEELFNMATMTSDGIFWFATNYGLMRYDPITGKKEHIETHYFRDVISVKADTGVERIWIGTYYGLFSYNPPKKRFVRYNKMDGAAPNEYNRTASAIQGDLLYMGGVKGMVQINFKEAIRPNTQPIFSVAECSLNGETQGNPFYHADKEVELPYRSNFFIRVLTQDKSRFRSRDYRFRIPNYSKEPIEVARGYLRLYNLLPGHYDVEVACTLNDGSWSDYQALASFEVLPPWYLSGWFILTNVLVSIALLTGGVWFYIDRKKRRLNRELAENRMHLKQEKIDFLVNVSHELRTPLTLIYAPLHRLLRESNPADKNFRLLQTACRQSNRMRQIINMVLDLEKMERKAVKLQMQPHPFNDWVADGMKDFVSEGQERGVQVVFQPDKRIGTVPFDRNKCDIVLNNLLMNALKHSPADTTLTVKTQLDGIQEEVKVIISDEGTGLQPGDEKELFTRFYQGAKESTGTGLGLAYSKVLLEQHKGSIGAYNNADKGASFYFTLPLKQDEAVVKAEVSVEQLIQQAETPTIDSASRTSYAAETVVQKKPSVPKPMIHSNATILVVDDQESIIELLKESLRESFKQVLTAKDGIEALKVLRSNRPDAVVSDVMMPRMDGFELCRQIKQDLDISHVPVILLTAKTDETSVRTGYKLGADMYLSKPFDLEVLKSILANLLSSRERMQAKYTSTGPMPLPEEVTISYADEAFLTKLNKLIEEHISNSSLDVSMIESEMCMSRATLFNKMKALTGVGCNEYITKLRMERATQLVKESRLTFVEISEKVGYNTASYFSTAFKQYTGMTPTQYRKQHKEN